MAEITVETIVEIDEDAFFDRLVESIQSGYDDGYTLKSLADAVAHLGVDDAIGEMARERIESGDWEIGEVT